MKSVLISISVAFFAAVTHGQPSQHIAVTGTAEVTLQADRAGFSYSVIGFGSTLRKAVEAAREKTRTTAARLLAMGYKKENLSTTSFHSGENYGPKPFLSSSEDYRAFITTHVRVDSLGLLEESILVLSDMKVDDISSITFSLKNEDQQTLKAVQEAIANGRQKAEQIARQAGVSIKRLVSIDERRHGDPAVPFPQPLTFLARETTGSPGALYSNQITVSATVHLVFEF